MKKQQIEKHLKSAICDMTPDIFGKISSLEVSEERESVIMNNKTSKLTKYITGFAACAAAIALFAGVTVYGSNYKVSSLVSIDVNPSIEISANKKDKVIKVIALNKDGETILDGMDLENIDLNIAVNSIMGSMVKNGFINEAKNSVLISVKNSDKEKSDELELALMDDIKDTLKENNVDAEIYNQKIDKTDKEIQKSAKEYGISYGKMLFIKSIMDKDSSLSIEQLSKLTLEEISDLIKEREIDISDIVNYNSDDSTNEDEDKSKIKSNNKYGDKDNDNNKYGEKDNNNNKLGDKVKDDKVKDNNNNKFGDKDNDNNKYGDKDNDNNKYGDKVKDDNKVDDKEVKDKDNNKDGEKDNDNNKFGDKDNDNNKFGDKDNDNNKFGEKDNDNNKFGDKVKDDDKVDDDDDDEVNDKDNNKDAEKNSNNNKSGDKGRNKDNV